MIGAFVSGVLFAAGLALSGMTDPAKVIGFLDVGGDWQPALAFVMGGALAVYAVAYRVALARGVKLHLAPESKIDAKLLTGAVIFGAGWGLVGYCPGPALVSLGAGSAALTGSMLAASWLTRVLMERQPRASADARAPATLPPLQSPR